MLQLCNYSSVGMCKSLYMVSREAAEYMESLDLLTYHLPYTDNAVLWLTMT